MYYILEKQYESIYTESIANQEFPSLQAAEKKLQALKELGDEEWFIVQRVQAWQVQAAGIYWDLWQQ